MSKLRQFGLIGKQLSHSFSKGYFSRKCEFEKMNCLYENYELVEIDQLHHVLKDNPHLEGLNVTFPYKEEVLSFTDEQDSSVQRVGSANVLKIVDGKIIAYNTDAPAFRDSLDRFLTRKDIKALVLGSGGASKAVTAALSDLEIEHNVVSRTKAKGRITYQDLTERLLSDHLLIINTTPLGTYPNTEELPPIPYEYLVSDHQLFDLIYNPAESAFLKKGKALGCKIKNGQEMLEMQADLSWEIWNR